MRKENGNFLGDKKIKVNVSNTYALVEDINCIRRK